MTEARPPPVDVSGAALKEAGRNAVHPESDLSRWKVGLEFVGMAGEERSLVTGSDWYDLTHAATELVNSNDKPSPDAAEQVYQQAKSNRQTANSRVEAVSSHLEDLKAKQIRWNNEAAKMLRQMDRSSPIGNVQSAQYAGSGDNQRMTRSPSWTIDEQKARQQEQDLSDLEDEIDKLNEQYQASIDAVAENVQTAADLFGAEIEVGDEQTTMHQLAGTYADAARQSRKYYAERADYLWRLKEWAADEQGPLKSKQSDIKDAVTAAARSGADSTDLVSVLGTRCEIFVELAPNESSVSCSTVKQRGYHEEWGNRIWYEIFEKGLSVVETDAETDAKFLSRYTPGNQGSTAYAQYTRKIEKAYTAREQLLTTYYGMIESYRGWRRDSELSETVQTDDSTAVAYDTVLGNRLNSLTTVLRPPRINDISVTRSQEGHTGTGEVSVSAAHPEGVAETSYRIRRGTGGDVQAAGDYYSIGDRTSFTLHSFAETLDQNTQDYTILARARGPGGATLMRRANFTLAVSEQGTGSAPDGPVDAMPTDDTPPEKLSLDFEYLRRTTESTASPLGNVSLQGTAGTGASVGVGAGGGSNTVSISTLQSQGVAPSTTTGNARLWTNSATTLRMEVKADDPDSDIAEIDYKIGTSKGASDVRDWRTLQGQMSTRNITTSGSDPAAVELNGVVRGLSLEEGTSYYVTIRARNGAGLTTVHEHDTPIVYDGTPPDKPGRAGTKVDPGSASSGLTVMASSKAIRYPPSWKGAPSVGEPEGPSLTVRWRTAEDEASSVWNYEYVVTRDNPASPFEHPGGDRKQFRAAYGDTSATITAQSLSYPDVISDQLSYTDSVWVHVRALDQAGNTSDPLTVGPALPKDPSPPEPPEVRPMVVPDGIRLYFVRPAYDQETGIAGYQYRVENAQTGTTLKAFPSGPEADFGPQCPRPSGAVYVVESSVALALSGRDESQEWEPVDDPMGCTPDSDVSRAPYYFLSADSLPTGEPLQVDVRTVDGQGSVHPGAYTESLVLDDSAPTLSASASSTTSSVAVSGSIRDAHDPESGVARVEYFDPLRRVWREVAVASDPPTNPQSYSFTIQNAVGPTGQQVQSISIRVTNGAGQETVKQVSVSQFPILDTGGSSNANTNWGQIGPGP
jgi:hypothetical protein